MNTSLMDMPMFISNLRRVIIDADGYENNGERVWHGTGLPVYRYDLRFSGSKRLYDTATVRARNPKQAIKIIQEQMPNVTGVDDL